MDTSLCASLFRVTGFNAIVTSIMETSIPLGYSKFYVSRDMNQLATENKFLQRGVLNARNTYTRLEHTVGII